MSKAEYYLLLKDLPNAKAKEKLIFFANTNVSEQAMFYMFGDIKHWCVFQGSFMKNLEWFKPLTPEQVNAIRICNELRG
jgi:hypothetical protein